MLLFVSMRINKEEFGKGSGNFIEKCPQIAFLSIHQACVEYLLCTEHYIWLQEYQGKTTLFLLFENEREAHGT
jgi:hypothetical protein